MHPDLNEVDLQTLQVGNPEHEAAATIALSRAQAVPVPILGTLIGEVGSAVRIAQLTEIDRLFAAPDPSHRLIGAATSERVRQALRDLRMWAANGIDYRSVVDPDYPADLQEIFNRPPMIFIRGEWAPASPSLAVAVVGTRKASESGLKRARRLATELVESGITVLSGLAAGIDSAAHDAALNAGGLTSAVFGTGLDRVYPSENEPLAKRILESGGALLSQFFPPQNAASWTFPMRNVVMSGLSKATVVVEASETSGAKMQARVAMQHGRTVFLLKSLVEQHAWAAKYVTEGAYGTFAIEISSTADITSRLDNDADDSVLAVA